MEEYNHTPLHSSNVISVPVVIFKLPTSDGAGTNYLSDDDVCNCLM